MRLRADKRPRTGARSTDSWPDEPFRRWILAQELAEWMSYHLGGKLPADWWGLGPQPFATFAASLALEDLGRKEEGQWVRSTHQGDAAIVFLWTLHDSYGRAWISHFFDRLRNDGVDFEELASGAKDKVRSRSLNLLAYLSASCETNLAERFARSGIAKAAGYDTISKEEVDRLVKALPPR